MERRKVFRWHDGRAVVRCPTCEGRGSCGACKGGLLAALCGACGDPPDTGEDGWVDTEEPPYAVYCEPCIDAGEVA